MFSQERAPTSVAYAENQSMFLDSFIDDAAWKGRYAKSRCCALPASIVSCPHKALSSQGPVFTRALLCRDGKVIPWELIWRGIEATHPYSVFVVRSMLAVPFFEKALYELPEDQVTPDHVTALADSIEKDVEGGLAGRSVCIDLAQHSRTRSDYCSAVSSWV